MSPRLDDETAARAALVTFDEACVSLGVRPNRQGRAYACCPLHDDRVASMSLAEGDGGRLLAYCHRCCPGEDWRAWYGQLLRVLRGWREGEASPDAASYAARAGPIHEARRVHVTNYDYPDGVRKARYRLVGLETGAPLIHPVTGKELKTFVWLHMDRARKSWLSGRPAGWRPRWYGEDRLGETGEPVWVCEGERDVDRVRSLGHLAVCAPDGAASRLLPDAGPLTGRRLVVVADHDEPGIAFARLQAAQLGTNRVLIPPTVGYDVSDHLDTGGSLDSLAPLPVAIPRPTTGGPPGAEGHQ
jgi:hypothetical protein